MQMGRIQASVPDVGSAIPGSWATACVPITGKQSGTWFVPQIGAAVWIEFEQGDPDHPIWTGCFWGSAAEVPSMAKAGNPAMPSIILQSGLQNSIVISDVPGVGGITLKIATGAQIIINDTGIIITNGKGATIALTGPTVTINNGALAVT
ncbi:MAG: hypothetical protein QOH21_2922, partial [Acidobacteriota bacterium]|jgi:uncharacterized protein involved in type VI secretion and phage assembly|nr:hypothetical protein [Acidobacteriota bacterium]